MLTILKLGGELLEDAPALANAAAAIVRLSSDGPLIVVHGGGRAIDAELRARGIEPKFVDGLRVTDRATLDAVVSVLAGRTNTTLIAAIGGAGGRAVGLTGADAGIGLSKVAEPLESVSGAAVDLGLVGQPAGTDARLLTELTSRGYIPVIASIGVSAEGELLNVNADTLAAHLATIAGAERLIVAGATAGVLDTDGNTIPALGRAEIVAMTTSGAAHSGMVAKLAACRRALDGGVREIAIVNGRNAANFAAAPGTRVMRELATR